MNITIIGSGYVGLVSGTCFSEMGNNVWCIDQNKSKIDDLNNFKIPIFEPGLEEMVKRNAVEGRLHFSTDLSSALKQSSIVFIAVGTPPDKDGSADLQFVLSVAHEIGSLIDKYTIVIDKSTVPVGTAELVREAISEELVKRNKIEIEFDVLSNPEFLKEGDAIQDFMRPDRIIVGSDSSRAIEIIRELYEPFVKNGHPVIFMDIVSAEMTKYAANAMLATRISFMNELSLLCEKSGADIDMVRKGIGSDSRIGMSFLYSGLGYGGSCFPKDVQALVKTYRDFALEAKILTMVDEVNKNQRIVFIEKILNYFNGDVEGRLFSIWGLSFKPQTDDMREAPSVDIINALRNKGASFKVYDPVAIESAKNILGSDGISYLNNYYDVLQDADALIIITEWRQFREPDFNKMKSLLKTPLIFDGRNQYSSAKMRELGFTYFSIGRQ